MKKNKLTILLIIIISLSCFNLKTRRLPIEDLAFSAGFGYDINKKIDNNVIYKISLASYVFQANKLPTTKVYIGLGDTIGETRANIQLKTNKKLILGLEKVYIVSEANATFGIKEIIDILFKNPQVNDTGFFLVCKGNAEDMLKYKVPGYPSSADYIQGMVENSIDYNFFPKQFKISNVYIKMSSEGQNLVVPYIEITEEGLKFTGEALFKRDKMVAKVDMQDSKILNLLSNTDGKGILTIQKSPKIYIDYDTKVKRKVTCKKEGDKYNFIINLKFKGDIISNEMYENMTTDISKKEEFEKDMAEKIELMCYDFINKMKKDYKVDCLNLGRVAAAKYGRNKGIDWDEEVIKSNIKVNVSVKVDKQGRGDY